MTAPNSFLLVELIVAGVALVIIAMFLLELRGPQADDDDDLPPTGRSA